MSQDPGMGRPARQRSKIWKHAGWGSWSPMSENPEMGQPVILGQLDLGHPAHGWFKGRPRVYNRLAGGCRSQTSPHDEREFQRGSAIESPSAAYLGDCVPLSSLSLIHI